MELVTSFSRLLQVFAYSMKQRTFAAWQSLAVGWLFASRRTVLDMVRSSGSQRHHAAFHRVFATARWSIDRVGLAVLDLILRWAPQETLFLSGDDTLLARRGPKVFGAGMHRDPLLSHGSHKIMRWGHCWVVLCVVIESPRTPGRFWALPVLARLYLNNSSAAWWRRTYRSKTDLMIEMLEQVQRHVGEQKLHFLGDSTFTAPAVLARIPRSITVTGRVRTDARLHSPPPERVPGKPGRPRIRGACLPNPDEMLDAPRLRRLTLKLYHQSTYRMRVAEVTARFFRTPDRDVRVIAVEHQRGGRGREVFYSTASDASAAQVLGWFARRWPIEVTFHDVKQHLGVDQPQSRKPKAVERTAPTGLLLYSLVVLWHEFVREQPAPPLRPWPGKQTVSLADMLGALRQDCLEQTKQTYFSTRRIPHAVEKMIESLERLLALAA
jgi:hypothetical protein